MGTVYLNNGGPDIDGLKLLEDVLKKTCPHHLKHTCEYLFSEGRLREEVPDPLGHMARNCHEDKYFKCETYQKMTGVKK